MKVERDGGGRVRRIAKTLDRWDAGYVGMTKVPRAAAARYWATVDAALAAEGRAIHVERVLARLADDGTPPLCRDISGHGWLEVDLPEERDHADETVRRGGWLVGPDLTPEAADKETGSRDVVARGPQRRDAGVDHRRAGAADGHARAARAAVRPRRVRRLPGLPGDPGDADAHGDGRRGQGDAPLRRRAPGARRGGSGAQRARDGAAAGDRHRGDADAGADRRIGRGRARSPTSRRWRARCA